MQRNEDFKKRYQKQYSFVQQHLKLDGDKDRPLNEDKNTSQEKSKPYEIEEIREEYGEHDRPAPI
jgi:hypothetical protein